MELPCCCNPQLPAGCPEPARHKTAGQIPPTVLLCAGFPYALLIILVRTCFAVFARVLHPEEEQLCGGRRSCSVFSRRCLCGKASRLSRGFEGSSEGQPFFPQPLPLPLPALSLVLAGWVSAVLRRGAVHGQHRGGDGGGLRGQGHLQAAAEGLGAYALAAIALALLTLLVLLDCEAALWVRASRCGCGRMNERPWRLGWLCA